MSMQAPLDVEAIEENRKKSLELRAKHTIGVVHPNGVISEHFCPPPEKGKDEGPKTGDSMVRWINGEPQINKRMKNKGFVLYAELAERDGEPQKYEAWQKAVSSRILGLKLRGDIASSLYSKSILDRRARYEAGSVEAGGLAYDVEKGEVVEDPEAARLKMADRLKEIGVGDPLAEEKAKAEAEASLDARKAELEEQVEAEAKKKLDAKMKKLEAEAKKKLDAKMKELESKATTETADPKAAKDGGKEPK